MRLLLDQMYAPTIAEQLRARGRDVASVHDPEYRTLEGEPDEEVWAAALAAGRVLVTENVQDFRSIETDALARAQAAAPLIFTTDRQFPRGDPATVGRLVRELEAPLDMEPKLAISLFLKPTASPDPAADSERVELVAERARAQPASANQGPSGD